MFNTDGVFLLVSFPPMPMLKATVSAKANFGIWQLAQLIEESLDNILSENNFLPRATLVFISIFFSLKEALIKSVKTIPENMKKALFIIAK